MNPSESNGAYRIERDPVGEKRVPADALYGVQTTRALENFRISRLRMHPLLITAFAEIKKAAVQTHMEAGKVDADMGQAIERAADEIIGGQWRDQFQLDVFQAGAGTSYNMNVNEVIANRALELLGGRRGDYARVNPNDDVNKAQSTNDVMPTAMRVTSVRLLRELTESLEQLADSFAAKAQEFSDVEKSGRTHLHDAVPMTLGEEFEAYGLNIRRAANRLRGMEDSLLEVPLGGTAIGNALNTYPDYGTRAVERLAGITRIPVREAENRIQLTQSLGDFVALSGALRGLAVELNKICNDLRLLSSGPHTGLAEIELPAVQPGSSIMPGKVNPAVAEMMNMVCFHVIGQDAAIAMCGEAGQLEVNITMPYVAYALFEGMDIMAQAARTFDESCVRVIRANRERCQEYRERSVGLAALHNEELGFMGAAELAKQAVETGKTIEELLEEGAGERQEA
jgi:fumarate hydratase class II/aspartate ammonia-lyase